MSDLNIEISSQDVIGKNSIRYQVEIERDYKIIAEQVAVRVLSKIADKFVEDYGDEIIGMIDMDKLGKQINSKVLASALKTLASEAK